jgi:hypothetical protein
MSTFPPDPVVDDAVAQLADALHAKLLDAVETAANRCLDSVEDDLQKRSDDIGAASRAVTEFLRSLGGEIRAQSGRAISDELKASVVPALEAQASSILDATERRIDSSLTHVTGRVNEVSAVLEKLETGLHAVAKGNTASLAQTIEEARQALRNEIASAREAASAHADVTARRIATELGGLRDEFRKADVGASQRDQSLQALVERVETGFAHSVADAERRATQQRDTLATEIKGLIREARESAANLAAGLDASVLARTQALEARTDRLEAQVRVAAERQQTILNRIWYLVWACAVLIGGVLTAVLTTR